MGKKIDFELKRGYGGCLHFKGKKRSLCLEKFAEKANKMTTEKLINNPKNAIDDSLYGLALTNRGVKLSRKHRTVFRADLDDTTAMGNVCLISGGGSGHEPSQAGFVGKRMLTAAVCGDVFTSPPASSILAAIKRCACSAGVLLIVTNYTGDRLNFGKAAEQAKLEGIQVSMIVVDDDAASDNTNNRVGRRGLCGTLFVHKIAGALAECGKALEYITETLQKVINDIRTISISLSSCSIPGQKATFTISPEEIEFGLGVHGEPGIKKIKISSSAEVIRQMIDYLTKNESSTNFIEKDVALIINNLGNSTEFEMNIVAKDLLAYLEKKQIHVKRCYAGKFMTSLEMAGISISIMVLDENRIQCLDMETSVSNWPRTGKIKQFGPSTI